jgi:MinD-like ATPase involved in chromosome partitioning or flagellar assembly
MSAQPAGTLKRRDVYPGALVDGRPTRNGTVGRLRRQLQRLLVSQGERKEVELDWRLRTLPGVTRANTVALISPKGGVGKTTSTFLVGNLLASHLKLRAIAVDANPDFGTLARLAPDERRCERSLADLLDAAERLNTAAELRAYVSRMPTGLHVLGAPCDAELTASLGPDRYGELVAFLSCFYEVVLLDLGTGVAGPLARFAIERADQVVLVTTPEWVTATVVLDALAHLQHDRTTVALNKSLLRAADVQVIEQRFRDEHLHRSITIPHDEQLATMLDTGVYTLEALKRPTRLAIKRLGIAVSEQLV